MKLAALFLAAFASSPLVVHGFQQPNQQQQQQQLPKKTSQLASSEFPVSTGWDSFGRIKNLVNVPSGEEQRRFRRTVYSHDDWRKHRNQDRFVVYLAAIFKSGVYKNLAGEVTLATLFATIVCFWNALAVGDGWLDLEGVKHASLLGDLLPRAGLPMSAFTLTSPSLGLLLVFRTNTSYQRWDEARKNWGMNINHTRDLVRMANAYYDDTDVPAEKRADDLNHVALCTWSFVRCMKRHLSPEDEDEEDFKAELYEKLPPQQSEMIIKAAHRPNRALQDLSYAVDDLPMHFMRKNEIHRAVTIFEDNLGSSERILTSPVPLFYSRHLARYLAVWLFLLPLGIYDAFKDSWNHIMMIPAMLVISTMLFGIEEIGTQLEEPFTVLPMQAFCDKIYNWCMEIVSWVPGDNGRPMQPIRGQHQFFTNSAVPGPGGGRAAPVAAAAYAPPPAEAVAPPLEAEAVAPPPQQPQPGMPPNGSPPQAFNPSDFNAGQQQRGPPAGNGSFEDFLRNQGGAPPPPQ